MSRKNHRLHHFNPDWDYAELHGRANKTGIKNSDVTSLDEGQQICKCCGEHIRKEPVGLWVHSKELEFLGFGFPLFYEFLKYCIVLLIINIGCYHALSLQQAVQDNYQFCHSSTYHQQKSTVTTEIAHKCYTFMIELARIQDYDTQQQLTVRCVSFAVHLLALLYIRNLLTKLEAYYDQRSTTLSDYAIVLKGINKNQGARRSIISFLTKQMNKNIPVVEQIIILPHFQKLGQIKHERQKVLAELRPYYSGDQQSNEQQKVAELQKKLKQMQDQIESQANASFQQIRKDKLPCQRAIIVFNTEKDKLNVLEAYENCSSETLRKYFGENSRVKIMEAPNPEEIIWENFNLPKKKRIIRTILGWLFSLIVLVAVFIVFYFILIEKSTLLEHAAEKLAEHPDDAKLQSQYNGAVALVFVLMFLVVLFDKLVLAALFHKFTQFELPSTTAGLQFSFALKLAVGLFFTTALMTLAVEAIKFQNYFTHPYGVVDEQSIMFFMNSFFVPFFWLVNPMWLIKVIKRRCHKGRRDFTQHQANKLMEQDSYDLGKRFAQVIETMWFVFLYATLIPVGAVIALFGLTFYYWVDKYNLLRRSKVHGKVSGAFVQTGLLMLDFTLILRPIGAIIFDLHIRGRAYQTSNIVCICIAFVYIIFPKNYFIRFFNEEFFRPQDQTYEQVKNKFKHNYHTVHPLYSVLSEQYSQKSIFLQKIRSMNSMEYSNNLINYNRVDSVDEIKKANSNSGSQLITRNQML